MQGTAKNVIIQLGYEIHKVEVTLFQLEYN